MEKYTRDEFLKRLGLITIGGFALPDLLKINSESPFKKIVFIVSDDHAAGVLGCYGNSRVKTPNLDKMAAEGIRFTNAFANSPVCTPSRHAFLTGKLPHATGTTLLQTSLSESQVTLGHHFRKYGFKSAIMGKNGFNTSLNHGFDLRIDHNSYQEHLKKNPPKPVPENIRTRGVWRPFKDHARIWLNSEVLPGPRYDKDMDGTFYANEASRYIEQNRDENFFLCVCFNEPHSPFNFPVEYSSMYRPGDMSLPKGSPEDDRWIPLVFKDLTDEEKRGIVAAYYTSVSFLDKNVGIILDTIRRLRLTDDTLVAYIGDHGYQLNDHKRFEKHTMWDPAVKAPLIFMGGKHLKAGLTTDAMVEFIDLAPTFADGTGTGPMDSVQGKSILPVLFNLKTAHREYVFSEFLIDNKVMLRSKEWKYVFTSGKRDLGQGYETGMPAPGVTHWLYNLKDDPGETTNLYPSGKHRQIVVAMQKELLKRFRDTHPFSDRVPENLPVEEQLILFCDPVEEMMGKNR